jgi:hypothetical protein
MEQAASGSCGLMKITRMSSADEVLESLLGLADPAGSASAGFS